MAFAAAGHQPRAALLIAGALAATALAGCGLGGSGARSRAQPTTQPPKSRILTGSDLLSARTPGAVSVFPIAGSRYNLPGTQITFRGISPARIGPVLAIGSRTGVHQGQLEADSDGHGASFLPSRPFAAGETVTVKTSMPVLGGRNGLFAFAIAHPAREINPGPLPVVPAGSGGVQQFRSSPELKPATVTVVRDELAHARGDIFVAPQDGPLQDGPMILDPHGKLVWFHPAPVSTRLLTTDFRVQRLHGRRVLTWWQGYQNRGSGRGVGIIVDGHYRRIATVHGGNGLRVDLHEFLITPKGEAYVIAASPIKRPRSSRPLIDSVVQEIDIRTGLVLFEWHALDHVKLSESYEYGPHLPGHVVDPYHANSISIAPDHNLIVSMRNTSATYKVDHRSGQIIWRLGGKDSSFALAPGASTAFQHDVLAHADERLSIFDNGAGPPRVHKQSRGLVLKLDAAHATATLLRSDEHVPPLSANFEGSAQELADGGMFLGYGQRPFFTQFDAAGREVFDARFTAPTTSYRAYRFRWSGTPLSRPSVRVSHHAGLATVYVSWNGATQVRSWRVLAGRNARHLHTVAVTRKQGFETVISVRASRRLAVAALGRSGRVLARSRVVKLEVRVF